jgi:hypothetical protein
MHCAQANAFGTAQHFEYVATSTPPGTGSRSGAERHYPPIRKPGACVVLGQETVSVSPRCTSNIERARTPSRPEAVYSWIGPAANARIVISWCPPGNIIVVA